MSTTISAPAVARETKISVYRLLRLLTGLSVNSFAKRVNVSHTYWTELEAGKKNNPSWELKHRIASICGLDDIVVDFLLNREGRDDSNDIYNFMILSINNYVKCMNMDKIAGIPNNTDNPGSSDAPRKQRNPV